MVEMNKAEIHRATLHKSAGNAGNELISIMEEQKIPLYYNSRLEEVFDDKIVCKDMVSGKLVEFPCDTVLLALGMVPLSDTDESLRRCTAETEVFIVGDALKVGNISTATNGGFQAAIHI